MQYESKVTFSDLEFQFLIGKVKPYGEAPKELKADNEEEVSIPYKEGKA